jgi:hypothetical protein
MANTQSSETTSRLHKGCIAQMPQPLFVALGSVAAVFGVLIWLFPTASEAQRAPRRNEDSWQHRYCVGMKLEQTVPYGGRVDCLSTEFAIEVDWAEHWAEALGQSLYYAGATGRKPAIILICPSSEVHAEGLCRSDMYRLEEALKFVNTHVELWECFPDTDATLHDCTRPQLQPSANH